MKFEYVQIVNIRIFLKFALNWANFMNSSPDLLKFHEKKSFQFVQVLQISSKLASSRTKKRKIDKSVGHLNRIDTRVAVHPVVGRQEALSSSFSTHNLKNHKNKSKLFIRDGESFLTSEHL